MICARARPGKSRTALSTNSFQNCERQREATKSRRFRIRSDEYPVLVVLNMLDGDSVTAVVEPWLSVNGRPRSHNYFFWCHLAIPLIGEVS
jgi:hypothetical protein